MNEKNQALFRRLYELCARPSPSLLHRVFHHPHRILISRGSRLLNINVPINVTTFFDASLRGYLPDPITLSLYNLMYYEPDLSFACLRILQPGSTFLDIGSHIGYFSTLASHIVGATGRVIAFEPSKETSALTQRNLRNLPNTRLERTAVWSTAGTLTFHEHDIRYSAFNGVFTARLQHPKRSTVRSVPATTIDCYVTAASVNPDFIKIDAESAEFEILRGGINTLEKQRPILSIEVGDYDVKDAPRSRQVLDFAIARGYSALEINEFQFRRHELKHAYEFGNIILCPDEKIVNLL